MQVGDAHVWTNGCLADSSTLMRLSMTHSCRPSKLFLSTLFPQVLAICAGHSIQHVHRCGYHLVCSWGNRVQMMSLRSNAGWQ